MSGPATQLIEDELPLHRSKYEWWSHSASVAGTTGDTNINTLTGFASIFTKVPRAHYIKIVTDSDAYFTINDITLPVIHTTATVTFESSNLYITSLFITTNGGSPNVTITLI